MNALHVSYPFSSLEVRRNRPGALYINGLARQAQTADRARVTMSERCGGYFFVLERSSDRTNGGRSGFVADDCFFSAEGTSITSFLLLTSLPTKYSCTSRICRSTRLS